MSVKEIGGYIELDTYHMPMLHDGALALNCGRNALAYLIKVKHIKRIFLPKFICDSVIGICDKEGTEIVFYHIDDHFKPIIPNEITTEEWLYLVNYYGQLTNEEIQTYAGKFKNIIVDQAQSYFQKPIGSIDTIYTCRKYFGVADGAFLYTDQYLNGELPIDESFERMHFLLGRFERSASEFYSEYVDNNHIFVNEPIKSMSKLTDNLLHGIDYKKVLQIRKSNFTYLHDRLKDINQLELKQTGTFMYPLMLEKGDIIRKKLQKEKIYIPTLWPTVFKLCEQIEWEYKAASNILPLPIDQRYNYLDMETLINHLKVQINSY